ncbi:MAG TPA: DsbA family protein [Candidatus Dormibacteraeota bacterium]|jgi:2-hydroxychromene-2-carboxylate isomerase|nr:DsbA family protein [Candidatus Dormibacteraeota bacterium]
MVLFADFNCPYSYALHERLRAMGAEVEWRGVEHAPGLPVPAAPPSDRAGFEREVAEVRALAEEVPLRAPARLPASSLALALAARAADLDPARAADLRSRVFRALWVEGRDISDPAVLRELARAAGLPPALVDGPGRVELARSPTGGVPALVRDDGRVLKGLVDPAPLRDFLAGITEGDVEGAW